MLAPLDLDLCITAPAPYIRTRIYAETLADETVFVLGEWCHTQLSSVAFPEITFPVVTALRKLVKGTQGGGHKGVSSIKTLVEKLEASAKWSDAARSNVQFGPGQRDKVLSWEKGRDVGSSPLDAWLKTFRKTREKQKKAAQAAAVGAGAVSAI